MYIVYIHFCLNIFGELGQKGLSMSCSKFLGDLGHFLTQCWAWTFQINTWHCQSIFAGCVSQHVTEATGNCLGPLMQKLEHLLEKQTALGGTVLVCMWWQKGQQEPLAKAQRWGRAPHPLLAPGSHKLWRHQGVALTGALCRCGGKFHLSACKTQSDAGAEPQRQSSTSQLELRIKCCAGSCHWACWAVTLQRPWLCKRTKGITKPQTMKTILNERINERKKVVKMSRLMFS